LVDCIINKARTHISTERAALNYYEIVE